MCDRRELDGHDELLLDLFPFDEEGPDGHIPDLGHIVSDGPFSRRKVELKIAGEFIAVMACGELPGDTDSFTLVDWRAGCGNNVSAHVHYPAFICEQSPPGPELSREYLLPVLLLPRPRNSRPRQPAR
jgi:hypothetical protein